jgi:hypothetical protein
LPQCCFVTIASWRTATSSAQDCGTRSGTGCAAPTSRVDLARPTFSNPTNISNPLFPVGEITSALQLGERDGREFRVEVTLLPFRRTIDWNGQQIETLTSQYVSYVGGQIREVAIDWYGQADDGAVWYFGEDVFNYRDGAVTNTEGTWLAGRDGPAAMIMPANPSVGDVYRPENIPGLVFEEVTVAATGVTVDGPRGPVPGAIVVRELQLEGHAEDKTFAPGYGEFSTGVEDDFEAVALAVPTDALAGPVPAELSMLSSGAMRILESADSERLTTASDALGSMMIAWDRYQENPVPGMLGKQMSGHLDALSARIRARDSNGTFQATSHVAQAALDLRLQYRPSTEIDAQRFGLWSHQLLFDARAARVGATRGDVATLVWIWDRFAHTLDSNTADLIQTQLLDLRAGADRGDLTSQYGRAGARDTVGCAGGRSSPA